MGFAAIFAACLLALSVNSTFAYPEPSIVPKSWDLDFKINKADTIRLKIPGQEKTKLFYYITYTVTNKTNKDQMYIPVAQLYTNRGHLIQAGRRVHPVVYKTIKKHLDNPLLIDPVKIVGKILQGPDHAKDGVFIWPVPEDKDIDVLRVFVQGLSGEFHKAKDPVSGKDHTLWKTLMLEYRTPGDQKSTPVKKFLKKVHKWIVR